MADIAKQQERIERRTGDTESRRALKYRSRLAQYKLAQKNILNAIITKKQELAKYYEEEKKEEVLLIKELPQKLDALHMLAKGLETVALRLETGESLEKSRKDETNSGAQVSAMQDLTTKDENQAQSVVTKENKISKKAENNFKKFANELTQTEKKVEEILVTVETLKLLIKYYWEVDEMIANFRQYSMILHRKELRKEDHVVHEALSGIRPGEQKIEEVEPEDVTKA